MAPNTKDRDGAPAFVHFTQADAPIRVAIGFPSLPAKHGTREDARNAAIRAMRDWETALQARVSWFALEFVEDDPAAPVQVEWKRRIPGNFAGFGGIGWRIEDGKLKARGSMRVTTTPSIRTDDPFTLDQLHLLIAHEFGHVLGLGHCHHCESAMNYSWATRERTIVTELDVRTFEALVAIPNGTRADGQPMKDLEH